MQWWITCLSQLDVDPEASPDCAASRRWHSRRWLMTTLATLTFVRIYCGYDLNSNDAVLNSTKETKERVGRMVLMHANNRQTVASAKSW
jgi:hypothetical protein